MSLCEADRCTLEELEFLLEALSVGTAAEEGVMCCWWWCCWGTDSLSELLKSDEESTPLQSSRGRDRRPYFFVPTTNLGDTSRSDDSFSSLSYVVVGVAGHVVVAVCRRSSSLSPDGTRRLLVLLLQPIIFTIEDGCC